MHKYYAFLDESGHTGMRLFDPAQPILIVGGYLAPKESLPAIRSAVARIEADYPETKELKGNQLLKTKVGLERLKHCIRAALRVGAFPVLWVWEKKFCIAGDVVETYFDPYHNDSCEISPKADEQRTALADLLFLTLPPSFFEMYMAPTRQNVRANIERFIRCLELMNRPDLAEQAEGNLRAIDLLVEALTSTEDRPGSVYKSLNYSSFFQISQELERVAKLLKAELTIVHDEQREYASACKAAFEDSRMVPNPLDIKIQSGTHVPYGIRPTTRLIFDNSNSDAALRMADFFAAAARHYTKHELTEDSCEHTDAIGKMLTPFFMDRTFQLCRFKTSRQFANSAMAPFYRLAREFIANSEK